jgi:hypothetical protein
MVFAQGNNNKLWPVLLEKVWAKTYGGFLEINGGFAREPLHDLTGAPVLYWTDIDKLSNEEKETMWNAFVEGEKKEYCMNCSS